MKRSSSCSNVEPEVFVFVYGSLRPSHHNAAFIANLRHAEYLGPASTRDHFHMYAFPARQFPYLLRPQNALRKDHKGTAVPIKGDLYKIHESAIPQLDYFEGHPGHYTRSTTAVVLDGDRTLLNAEIYLLEQSHIIEEMKECYEDNFVYVEEGDWTLWMTKQADRFRRRTVAGH